MDITSHPRPWVRFWARLLDMTFYSMMLAFIFPRIADFSMFLLQHVSYQWQEYVTRLAEWILINLVAYIFFEGILLSTLGTTLGKMLFKVSLQDAQGKKLSFIAALKRTFLVYFRGLALLLPLISIITLIYSYISLKSSGTTSWDKECHTVVSHQKIGALHIIAAIILFCMISDLKNAAMGINMHMFGEKMMHVCGIRG